MLRNLDLQIATKGLAPITSPVFGVTSINFVGMARKLLHVSIQPTLPLSSVRPV